MDICTLSSDLKERIHIDTDGYTNKTNIGSKALINDKSIQTIDKIRTKVFGKIKYEQAEI